MAVSIVWSYPIWNFFGACDGGTNPVIALSTNMNVDSHFDQSSVRLNEVTRITFHSSDRHPFISRCLNSVQFSTLERGQRNATTGGFEATGIGINFEASVNGTGVHRVFKCE